MANIDELLSQIRIDGSIEAKDFVNSLLVSSDDLSQLNDFKQDFKRNFLEPFSKRVKELKLKDIKNVFDPFGISDQQDNLQQDIKKYREKIKKFLNTDFVNEKEDKSQEKFRSTNVSQILPEKVQKLPEIQTATDNKEKSILETFKEKFDFLTKNIQQFQNVKKFQEQKTLGESIPEFNYAIETRKFLEDLILVKLIERLPKSGKTKTEIEEESGGGGLLGTLGLLALLAKFKDLLRNFKLAFLTFIDDLIKLPDRIWNALKALRLVLRDFGAWVELRWEKYVTEPLKRLFKALKFDELFDSLKLKWTQMIDDVKKFLKFDDIAEWINLKFEKYIKGPILSLIDKLSEFKTRVVTMFDGFIDMFKTGGKFSFVETAIKGLGWLFSKLKAPFESLKPLGKPVLGFFKGLGKILGPLALIIDPVITTIQTFFNLWGDENLSPLQKGIAIITGIVTSFGDILFFVIDMLSQGVTGLWNFITGNGFKTENPVSKWMNEKLYRGEGGFGTGAAMGAAEMMRDYNKDPEGTFTDMAGGAIKRGSFGFIDPFKNKEEERRRERLDKMEEDGVVDDAEMEEIDSWGTLPVDDLIKSKNKGSSLIVDPQTKQVYETSPNDEIWALKSGGVLDKALGELRTIMTDVNKNIMSMSKNISNIKPSNNSSINVSGGNTASNKEYLFENTRDPIFGERSNWWNLSQRIRSTV